MPASHKSVKRQLAAMSLEELRGFIQKQSEIEDRCANPLPRNAMLHRQYTLWAKDELRRRESAA